MLPLVSHGANLFNLCPFPDSSALKGSLNYVHNIFPIGLAVGPHFPVFWISYPLTPHKCHPGVSWGELFLADVHSQMNPQTGTKFGANRSSRLAAFPDLNLWPHNPPPPEMHPRILRVKLYLAYVHSQTNPQTCHKFGANRSNRLTASQDFWICEPLTPQECPLGYWGVNCI